MWPIQTGADIVIGFSGILTTISAWHLKALSMRPHFPATLKAIPETASDTIGREHELSQIRAALGADGVRLVTLVGPPGVGKSHLALAIMREHLAMPETLSVFVPLATLDRPDDLLPAIGAQLGTQSSTTIRSSSDHIDQIGRVTSNRSWLLVLDAFDFLPVGAETLVAELLAVFPGLTIIVTSRTPIGIPAETLVAVNPFPMPDPDRVRRFGVPVLAPNPAAQLFLARAREVQPGFAFSRENAETVAVLMTQTAGLPLAIELVAAQLGTMSPVELAPMLTAGPDMPLVRLMEEMLAWSYRQLSPAHQHVFRSLAVYRDGFDRDRVAHALDISPGEATAGLAHLATAGLIAPIAFNGAFPRFRMLDLPRDIAGRLMTQHGEREMLHERQAAWFLMVATEADMAAFHADQDAGFALLDAARSDLNATLAWLDSTGRQAAFIDLIVASKFYWLMRVRYAEGVSWLQKALGLARSIAPGQVGSILLGLGYIHLFQSNLSIAETMFAEAQPVLDIHGNTRDRAVSAMGWSAAVYHQGDVTTAFQLHALAAEHARTYSTILGEGMDALFRANVALNRALVSPPPRSVEYAATIDASLAWLHMAQATWVESIVFTLRTFLAILDEQYDLALHSMQMALTRTFDHHLDKRTAAEALAGIALVAVRRDQPERAALLLGAHDLLVDQIGGSILYITRMVAPVDVIRAQTKAAIGPSRYTRLVADGRLLSQSQLLRLADTVLPEWPVVAAGLWTSNDPPCDAPVFSVRELDALELLMQGLTNDDISRVLPIGKSAVAKRVERILQVTGAPTRHAAAHYARVRGMIEGLTRSLPHD